MGNGTPDSVCGAIDGLRGDIKLLMREGCAKRDGDMQRVAAVERATEAHGKKLDRIFWTSLVTAGGIIAFLLKAFLPALLGVTP